MAVREGLFLRELCHDLGLKIQTPTPLLLDNKSVRSIWRSIQWLSRKPNTFYETRTSCATKSPSLWLDLPMFAPRISWRTFSRSLFGLVWFVLALGSPPHDRDGLIARLTFVTIVRRVHCAGRSALIRLYPRQCTLCHFSSSAHHVQLLRLAPMRFLLPFAHHVHSSLARALCATSSSMRLVPAP